MPGVRLGHSGETLCVVRGLQSAHVAGPLTTLGAQQHCHVYSLAAVDGVIYQLMPCAQCTVQLFVVRAVVASISCE